MKRSSFLAVLLLASIGSSCFRSEGGTAAGGGGGTTADSPELGALARYLDANGNGVADEGDRIVVPFTRDVRVNSSSPSSFVLHVNGDSFGSGARVVAGPASHEVSVLLGAGATLKTRQDAGDVDPDDVHPPSGIALADDLPADAIENAVTGDDASPGGSLDIAPGFVEGLPLADEPARDLALADLDRDGDLDLLLAPSSGGASFLAGDGDGGFASGTAFGSSVASSLAVQDFDHDAIADVLLGVPDGIELWLGDGAGQYARVLEWLGLGEVRDVAIGDVDQDGDVDAVLGGAGGLRVLRTATTPYELEVVQEAPGVLALALGDADGDGRIEIFAATETGVSTFTAPKEAGFGLSFSFGDARVDALALGDLDRDGSLDVVTGDAARPRAWLGTGGGSFVEAGLDLGAAPCSAVHAVDVDSDGFLDLALADDSGTRVLRRQGDDFVDSGERLGADAARALATGDVDRDGDLDLVLAPQAGGPVPCKGSLAGSWGGLTLVAEPSLGTGDMYFALSSTDVEGDGDVDVLAAQSSRVILLRWNGDDEFESAEVVYEFGGTRINDLVAGDVDLDGDPDFVLGLHVAGQMVWLNDGTGSFTAYGMEQDHGVLTKVVELGDIDLDGDLDLVQGNMSAQPDSVRFNLGGGTPEGGPGTTWLGFGPAQPLLGDDGEPLEAHTGDVRLADLDRDGDLDLVCGHGPHTGNRWFRNDGSGAFAIETQLLGLINTRSIAAGDLDRDGDVDLVMGTALGAQVFVNDGNAIFVASEQVSLGNTYEVRLADIDGDGALDLLSGNSPAQTLEAWHNDGSGSFDDDPWFGLDQAAVRSVLAADLDRDGDVDLLSGNIAEPTLQHWLSR